MAVGWGPPAYLFPAIMSPVRGERKVTHISVSGPHPGWQCDGWGSPPVVISHRGIKPWKHSPAGSFINALKEEEKEMGKDLKGFCWSVRWALGLCVTGQVQLLIISFAGNSTSKPSKSLTSDENRSRKTVFCCFSQHRVWLQRRSTLEGFLLVLQKRKEAAHGRWNAALCHALSSSRHSFYFKEAAHFTYCSNIRTMKRLNQNCFHTGRWRGAHVSQALFVHILTVLWRGLMSQ